MSYLRPATPRMKSIRPAIAERLDNPEIGNFIISTNVTDETDGQTDGRLARTICVSACRAKTVAFLVPVRPVKQK